MEGNPAAAFYIHKTGTDKMARTKPAWICTDDGAGQAVVTLQES